MISNTTLGVTDDEKFFELTAGLYHKAACSSIPGMRVHEGTTWRAPVTWATACAIAKTFPKVVLDESAREYTRRVHSEFVSIANRFALSMDFSEAGSAVAGFRNTTRFSLFDYQEGGAEYLSFAGRAGLFDPMGTGKTAQTISALRVLDAQGKGPYPALVIAPNSVKRSWANEFKLWLPEAEHRRVVDFGNTAKARKEAIEEMKDGGGDVLVVNWEGLYNNSRHAPYGSIKVSKGNREPGLLNAIDWRTVVADEAHRAKNPDAKQTRALWFLRNEAKFRFALTGTPMANSPADLWALLFFLWPEEFPSKTKFIDRYCLVGYGDWGGIDVLGLNPESRAEFDQVTRHLWRRTPKEVALPSLPPKVPFTRLCTMKPAQARQYKDMVEKMLVEVESGEIIVATNPLARMTRLLQFASATGALDAEKNEIILKAPSCKVDQLFIELDDIEDHEQIVVFAQSRKLIELCQDEMEKRIKPKKTTSAERRRYSFGMITGKQSLDERQNNVEAFQRGDLRVMLCTLAAGGTGITLTAASTMIFLQRSFSLIDNEQAEGRCHRIGSEIHESINIIDIVSEDTLDEHVRDVSRMKKEGLEALLQDTERMRSLMLGRAVDLSDPEPEDQGEAA